MRLAILGATSQIAKDLVLSFAAHVSHDLVLFARHPETVRTWLASAGLSDRYTIADFAAFDADQHFDAVLNFVGVGNPAQASAMGASIFDVTLQYDQLALSYLHQHPGCRYLFLSSGAAYGSRFDEPADEDCGAKIAINHLQPQEWYAVAKLHAECRHRSLAHLSVFDIRVFNYFSHTQDLSARFFITDLLRAIRSDETLITSPDNVVRDYIGPDDFYRLVAAILENGPTNDVVDCYTRAPVEKFVLLAAMQGRFGLKYEVRDVAVGINATGVKMNYFSRNRRAETLGYLPSKTSLESVLDEARIVLDECS